MRNFSAMILGASLGACSVYMFDPNLGRRRRALFRDRMRGRTNDINHFFDVALRDLKHRTIGMYGQIRYRTQGRYADARKLCARVETKMGRYCSHPKALGVAVDDGVVTIRGHILQHEVNGLLKAIATIPGVKEVRNQLTVHSQAENFPSLQGGTPRTGDVPEVLQENWSPATRLLMGGLGALAVMKGLNRTRRSDSLLLGAGLLLLGRSIGNRPILQQLHIKESSRGIPYQKHLHIYAPVQEVFDFIQQPTSFPRVVRSISEVLDLGEGRSQWTIRGPAGRPVTWQTRITRTEANRLICFESEQDGRIIHSGEIRFEPVSDASTRLMIRVNHHPASTPVAHVVAMALGPSLRHEFEMDLLRLKTFLETGKPAHDVARLQRQERIPRQVADQLQG